MSVHIGERIRRRAKELRIGPTELGRMINTSKQNIYGIFARKSIDTDLLHKISQALDCDFFEYFSSLEIKSTGEGNSPYLSKNKELKSELKTTREQLLLCRKELLEMKEKYALLERINSLLEQKNRKA